MTAPRPHAELAARLERLETTIQAVCQYNGGYNSLEVQEAFYDVVHELQDLGIDTKPPPVKRTITLTVNGREWVLPEPLKDALEDDVVVWNTDVVGEPCSWVWRGTDTQLAALQAGNLYATADDTQAWADFDKWCRGGGHD